VLGAAELRRRAACVRHAAGRPVTGARRNSRWRVWCSTACRDAIGEAVAPAL